MKALSITAALAALVLTAACGGDAGQDAGGSVEPGPTGTIESSTEGAADGAGAAPPVTPNAPPAMTSPATEGDTTVRAAEAGH